MLCFAAIASRLDFELTPEDLFAYAYAILSAPTYFERFSEELRQPGPRLPITADRELFLTGAARGRRLIWLHTFGERMADPPERARGRLPAGAAKVIAPVGSGEEEMPAEFFYDEEMRELRIGTSGRFGPIGPEVWAYSVSGWQVVRNWLRFRMRDPVGRARSSGSALDAIRPRTWPAEFTVELLELLTVLEHTLARHGEQDALLDAIASGGLIAAPDLPEPSEDERRPPRAEIRAPAPATPFE